MAVNAEKYPVTWYRSTIFSAWMVAATAFTCPGIFGALNGMGAGGGASDSVSDAANAILFGILAVGSLVVGGICNRIGPKWTLVLGTLGYAPYVAGFYLVDKYSVSWLVLFGSVTCGISASFLWVGSGAIYMGYSEENRKGINTALKFSFQNLGASLGGIINLALNLNRNYRGSVTSESYIALMTIMCLGLPFALAVSRPSKVQRSDGRKVELLKAPSLVKEYSGLWNLIKTPTVLALLPITIYAYWFLSYQWGYNSAYFTVRTRALNSMLFYISGSITSIFWGLFLDWERFSRRTRAIVGFWVMLILTGASWIIGLAVQVKYAKAPPTLDWASEGYGLGCFVFVLWGVADPLVTTYKYWIAASLTNHVSESALLSAVINGVGSLGSTFGFVVSVMKFSKVGACAINFALFFASIPSLAWIVYTKVSDTSHGVSLNALAVLEETSSSLEEPEKTGAKYPANVVEKTASP